MYFVVSFVLLYYRNAVIHRYTFFFLAEPKHKECPSPNGFFLIPKTDCKEYYDCCNDVPTKKTCSKGLLFNQERGICDWEELVTCPDKGNKYFIPLTQNAINAGQPSMREFHTRVNLHPLKFHIFCVS